ncbi:hypothetical protein [Modestobacter roseus]|uniref:Uncharacterized protein n=1 Tax=Modestobacter roseus TaxID=1181884 RepID=A0A562IMX8_9ACTN|nr:hypothetical protein [Modestobacter roseus]TWH72075.1 hypothetical protein JD78_00579 [Modestobacter roseus]
MATSTALELFETHAPGNGALAHLTVVAVVTGVIGLVRFTVLRWLLGAAPGERTTVAA